MKKGLVVLFLLAGAAVVLYAVFENPHDFSGSECGDCHSDHRLDPRKLVAPVTEICRQCHPQMTMASSHPVDVYPAMTTIPSDLPLRNRMVVCVTCHNIHGKRFGAFGEKTYFLRRPVTGRGFCISCHKTGAVGESHASTLEAAHMGERFRVLDTAEPLDEVSVGCISCHDGIVGRIARFAFGSGVWMHNSPGGSHPVGVHYDTSRMRTGNLKPRELVDKRIRFVDGRIGCATCHNLYHKAQNYLVMSNAESRLCRSCHEL